MSNETTRQTANKLWETFDRRASRWQDDDDGVGIVVAQELRTLNQEWFEQAERYEQQLGQMRAWYKLTELVLNNLRSVYEESKEDAFAVFKMAWTLLRAARHAINHPSGDHAGCLESLAEGIAQLDAAMSRCEQPRVEADAAQAALGERERTWIAEGNNG